MNESIMAAAKEVGFYIAPTYNVNTAMMEKFAQVLLKETIQLVGEEIKHAAGQGLADRIVTSLKTRYGV